MSFDDLLARHSASVRRVEQVRQEADGYLTYMLLEAENERLRIEHEMQDREIRVLRCAQAQDGEHIVSQSQHINRLRDSEARLASELAAMRAELAASRSRVRHALHMEMKEHKPAPADRVVLQSRAGKISQPPKRDLKLYWD